MTIRYVYGSCKWDLQVPTAFGGMNVADLRKLWKMAMVEFHRNAEAIQTTASLLQLNKADSKDRWDKASADFVNGYKDTDPRYSKRTPLELKMVKAENNRLRSALKTAKRQHDRADKVLQIFIGLCEKYNIPVEIGMTT